MDILFNGIKLYRLLYGVLLAPTTMRRSCRDDKMFHRKENETRVGKQSRVF